MSGNVFTFLMLPVAFALVDEVDVGGCDGRATTENYFWKHNPAIQYSDDLMRDAFAAHPAFFRTATTRTTTTCTSGTSTSSSPWARPRASTSAGVDPQPHPRACSPGRADLR